MQTIRSRTSSRRAARRPSARFSGIELLETRIAPATHTWIGPATGGLWSNAANWSGGVPTTGEGGGTIVQFNGNVSSTDNIAGLVVGQIHFTGGGNTILGTGGVSLGLDGLAVPNNLINDTGDNTIDASLPVVFTNANVFALVTTGKIHLNSNLSGTFGFTMVEGSANGTVTFAGTANTYAGSTVVRDGTLELDSNGLSTAVPGPLTVGNNLGAGSSAVVRLLQSQEIANTSAVTVDSDGWLDFNNHNDTVASLTVQSGTTSGALVSTGSANLGLTAGSALTLSVFGTGAVGATISGTLDFSTGTHPVNVADGAAATDLLLTARVLGSLTKNGAGTLEFASTQANVLSSDLTVADGTLVLNSSAVDGAVQMGLIIGDNTGGIASAQVVLKTANQIANASAITIHTDGRLTLSDVSDTVAGLTMENGTAIAAGLITGNGTLGLEGNLTIAITGTGASAAVIVGHLDFGANLHSIVVPDGAASSDLLLAASVAGDNGYAKSGAGTLQTLGAGPSGPIYVSAGTLLLNSPGTSDAAPGGISIGTDSGTPATVQLLHAAELGQTSLVYVHSDGVLDLNGFSDTLGGLTLYGNTAAAATVTTGVGTLTMMGQTNASFLGTGATAPTISGQVDFHGSVINVSDGAASSDLVIPAKIVGSTGYTKSNDGTMEVKNSGPTGTVSVFGGTLLLNSNGISDAIQGTLVIGLSLGTTPATVRLLQNLELANTITVSVRGTGTLDLNNHTDTLTNLVLDEGPQSGAQVVMGTGTLTVKGNVVLTAIAGGGAGATIAGKLNLPAGSHEFNIAKGAAGSDLKITAPIAGAGDLVKDNTGTLEISNHPTDNTYTGVTAIHDGVLLLTAPLSTDSTSDQIIIGDGVGAPGTAILRLGQSSVIANAAVITVASDGLLDIGSQTDGMGPVTVQAHGALRVGNGIPTTGDFNLQNGSTLILDSAGYVSVAGTVTLAGAITQGYATAIPIGNTKNLILNDGNDAVAGTFAGLPEGAVFGTPAGLLKISYHGGDGNDVVLTSVDAANVVTIAPTGKSATFTDVDGDLVTVKITKGTLTKDNFQFGGIGSGIANGYQLQTLLLTQSQYDGAAVTITAKPTALGGNGHVNVGSINALGHDLASVSVPGDVSFLQAGDNDVKKPGLGKFVADSMGVLGPITQRLSSVQSAAVVNVGTFLVKGDVRASNLSLGSAGTVTIGGSLFGDAASGAGNLVVDSAKKVTVGGSLVAAPGTLTGCIISNGDLLAVTIGLDVVGAARIVSNGKLGAVTIKGGVAGAAPTNPALISGAGAAVAPKSGPDTAIASLTIAHSAENLLVRAGYTFTGTPVSADAAIGKVMIGGDLRASNILVGAATGNDGLFGTADDTKVSVMRDSASRYSTIASLIIKGQALGTANGVSASDFYAIVAEQITSAKIGGATLKLKPGARTLADTFPLGFLGSGPGNLPSDFYLHEISA